MLVLVRRDQTKLRLSSHVHANALRCPLSNDVFGWDLYKKYQDLRF